MVDSRRQTAEIYERVIRFPGYRVYPQIDGNAEVCIMLSTSIGEASKHRYYGNSLEIWAGRTPEIDHWIYWGMCL